MIIHHVKKLGHPSNILPVRYIFPAYGVTTGYHPIQVCRSVAPRRDVNALDSPHEYQRFYPLVNSQFAIENGHSYVTLPEGKYQKP